MTLAAQIVRSAVAASGGLGEPWCSDLDQLDTDAVRVSNRLMVVETDRDTYGPSAGCGWQITVYAVPDDGGKAAPIAVVGADNGDAVPTLTSVIQKTGRPMTWTRIKPGMYQSGPYLIGRLDTCEWFAEGPGVDQCFDHKAQAQAACDSARGLCRFTEG